MKGPLAIILAAALGVASATAGSFPDYNQGIRSNDARIVGWATGWQDYIQPDPSSGGYCHNNAGQSDSISNAVLGAPADFTMNGTTKHVLALGHASSITVTFGGPIPSGPGWNFAVFENSFLDMSSALAGRSGGTNFVYDNSGTNLVPVARGVNFIWTKLAFVDVSSDDTNWARFPATYLNTDVLFQATVPDSPQHWLSQDATMINGLAGTTALQYGTPFSLSVLTNNPNVRSGAVNLSNIRYIRLSDVIGDGSTTDQFGNVIYSPYYDGSKVPALVAAPDSATDGFCLRGVATLAVPVPTITGVQLAPSGFLIGVSGLVSGQTYAVQTTTNLIATTWTNETNFAASGNSLILTNTIGNAPTQFYRIGAAP
ncbi:MAG TPA: hypothetical protein VMV72_13120 [Verrucomicrobiae bacterium]|nr:hypothetical protein [Verrucomicrobiae bacterium]